MPLLFWTLGCLVACLALPRPEDTYTSSSSLLTSPLSPARSFHHQLPSFSRTESAIADIRSQLLSWDLDCSLVTHDELSRLAYDIFKMSGVVDELELPVRELSRFLSAVASHYHDVPYHNFTHAVQVLHTVWMVSVEGTHPKAYNTARW